MKIYTLLIILFSLLTNAQNTTPVLEVCDFGVESLNAELHQGRLVDGNKIFAIFSINDTIKKIDYLRLNIVFNKKISKSKLNSLKKSLIDKYKISPSEIAIDDKDNSVEIIKKKHTQLQRSIYPFYYFISQSKNHQKLHKTISEIWPKIV